jgi:hypothetical protein
MKPHRGTLILVLGILGLIICGPLAIVAWILGANDLKEMDAGMMDPAGRGNTQAGKICGIIGTILLIIGILVVGLFFMFGVVAALATHGDASQPLKPQAKVVWAVSIFPKTKLPEPFFRSGFSARDFPEINLAAPKPARPY